jgi:protein TonB
MCHLQELFGHCGQILNTMNLRSLAAILAPVLWITVTAAQVEPIETLGLEVISDEAPAVEEDRNDVFVIVEQMPQFPGGQGEMQKFLGGNLKYPEEAVEAGISGAVYVTFVVDKDGSIVDARVLRGIGGGCDEEALRVVRSMPKWEPGVQRGKPVRVQYNLPIRYSLRNTDGEKK